MGERLSAPVSALNAPSGIDTATGVAHDPAILATATMTLALPKEGLLLDAVRQNIGALYLADISVPPALYASPQLDIKVGALFGKDDVIQRWYFEAPA